MLNNFTSMPMCIQDLKLGVAKKGPPEKKISDFQKNLRLWSLGPPEPISKEFLSPAWKSKSLANFENLTFYNNFFSYYSNFSLKAVLGKHFL